MLELEEKPNTETAAPNAVTSPPLEDVACSLCGQYDAEPVAVGEDFEDQTSRETFLALRCERCDLIYLSPRPAADWLPSIYPADYHAFDFFPEHFGLAYKARSWIEKRRVLDACRGLGASARILDVGCGNGFHIHLLRTYGRPEWHIEGIDADSRAVDAARTSGLDVHHGDVRDVDLPLASYDLVLLNMTLEHLSNPLATVRRIRELLRPGGRLLVVTDNTATPGFEIFGRRHWGGFHFPRHWNLFNAASLRALIERAELETDQISTAVSPVNWVYSFRNLLLDWKAPVWLIDRFSLSSSASLIFFTLVDAFWMVFGRGSILRASAHRPKTTLDPDYLPQLQAHE